MCIRDRIIPTPIIKKIFDAWNMIVGVNGRKSWYESCRGELRSPHLHISLRSLEDTIVAYNLLFSHWCVWPAEYFWDLQSKISMAIRVTCVGVGVLIVYYCFQRERRKQGVINEQKQSECPCPITLLWFLNKERVCGPTPIN